MHYVKGIPPKILVAHDAVTYLALMIGMHRHTVSKGIQKLMDLNILWCAIDGERKVLRSLKAGVQHKHFLLVGLSVMLESESQKD
jgi:hypothetical protein